MKKLLFFFFLTLIFNELKAAVFTVTSNADSGPGSLRETIGLANANGINEVDYIRFNLPGSSLAAITIALESELPILTSNMVIDGTSQPLSVLGNPNIKISLIRATANYFNGLRLDNAKNIEIYGMSFSNFKADPQGSIDEKKSGIYLYNSSNIIIGAPNKQNCFGGNYAGILSPFIIPKANIESIKISSNIFGLSENGLNSAPNDTGIDLSFLRNGIIGGDTAEEGNLLATNTRTGIALGAAEDAIKIANNIIGLDKNSNLKASPAANGIYVNGVNSAPNIVNNIIAGQLQGILIDYVNGGFVIAGNRIGTGLIGSENLANSTGIHINFSNIKGVIGGTKFNETNFIAYNSVAILIENSYPISILKNSIYCNKEAVTFKNVSVSQVKINSITTNEISGVYLPNSKIELFHTDDCGDCQGKTWVATILADANGAWSFNGSVANRVTAMGTNADGATSTFSKPIIDDADKQIIGVYCGNTNGSIKNIHVFDSNVFQWINAAGQVVGNTKDLENVGAGTYYLKAGQLGACDVKSATYTISSQGNGIDDSNKKITDVLCGKATGSIKNIFIADNLTRTWYNSAGNIISVSTDLENVIAGSYYFKASSGACEITSAVYTIKNNDITFKVKTVDIAPASCGKSNGSVKVLAYETQSPIVFSWSDNAGNVVSNTENLIDVSPGTYTLTVSNGNNCTNVAGVFSVGLTELPIINLSKMQQFLSCDGKTVSTSAIEVIGSTGPYIYNWLDANGNNVYQGLNIQGTKPGKYILSITDKFGCSVNTETIDFTQLENKTLQIPNSITPNGDGINDTWKIIGASNYPDAEFYVFNRNGDKIFYSKGYVKDFDGTKNGKTLSVGVYYYMIDLKTDCGKLSGSLTILK